MATSDVEVLCYFCIQSVTSDCAHVGLTVSDSVVLILSFMKGLTASHCPCSGPPQGRGYLLGAYTFEFVCCLGVGVKQDFAAHELCISCSASSQPTREVVAEKRPAETQSAVADGGDRKRRRLSPPGAASKASRFEDPVSRLVPPEARVGSDGLGSGRNRHLPVVDDEPQMWSDGAAATGNGGIDEEERQRILRMVEEANPEVG